MSSMMQWGRVQRVFLVFVLFFCLVFSVRTNEVQALGMSAPEVDLGFIENNTTVSGIVKLSRAVDEYGDILIRNVPDDQFTSIYAGLEYITIPDGQASVEYAYSITPNGSHSGSQLFINRFHHIDIDESGNVSVLRGIGLTIRFSVVEESDEEESGGVTSGTSGPVSETEEESSYDDISEETLPEEENLNEPQSQETFDNTEEGLSELEEGSELANELVPESDVESELPFEPEDKENESYINEVETQIVEEATGEIALGTTSPPPRLILLSDTEYGWFNTSLVLLSWTRFGAYAEEWYYTNMYRIGSGDQEVVWEKTNNTQIQTLLDDGEYLFSVYAENEFGRSEVQMLYVRVDTVEPGLNDVLLTKTKSHWWQFTNQFVTVSVFDQLSGVQSAFVDSQEVVLEDSVFAIQLSKKRGVYYHLVDVVDYAGNSSTIQLLVNVEAKYPFLVSLTKLVGSFFEKFGIYE